jgi:hypothetical protein
VTLVNGIPLLVKEKNAASPRFFRPFFHFFPLSLRFTWRQRRHGDHYDFSSPSRWFRPQFDGPVTVAQVASSIGTSLAKAALAGKVDGKLVDTSYLIDKTSIWPSSPTRMPKAWR